MTVRSADSSTESASLIGEIAQDERVGSIEAAREILIDAFQRVKGYAPYSFGIMSADYGERSIEAAMKAHQTRLETSVAPEPCDNPETDVHKPSREDFGRLNPAEVNAALLLTWSDERWQAWADRHVADLVKVRQMLVDKGFGFEPYTEAEIESMWATFTMPQTDAEKLDWLRNRVDDHAQPPCPRGGTGGKSPDYQDVHFSKQWLVSGGIACWDILHLVNECLSGAGGHRSWQMGLDDVRGVFTLTDWHRHMELVAIRQKPRLTSAVSALSSQRGIRCVCVSEGGV